MWNNNLFPKIHFHPALLLFIIISVLTGTFVELFILFSIVLFHELGHYLMAVKFNWRIRKIMLWIFGGVMDTEEHGTRPIYEEMLVICAGPFQHLILQFIIVIVSEAHLFSQSILDLLFYYNTVIFLFNLLPIFPLDGGKLVQLFISKYIPYKKAYYFTVFFSMVVCLLLLVLQIAVFSFTLSTFFLFIFLFMENRMEWKRRTYAFIRFLLKRYEKHNKLRKQTSPIQVMASDSLMDVFSNFYRERNHTIYIKYPNHTTQVLHESVCLHHFFSRKGYIQTIGEVADKMK